MKKKVVLAGGGTGGHVYPALAIAQALKKKGCEVHFIGTRQGLEARAVPREDIPIDFVPVGKFHKSVPLFERLKTLFLLPWAFIKSAWLIKRLQPDVVFGVGGYVSGPPLLMAHWMGYKTCIWEPNAYPGLTNRWLSRWVDESLVVFEEALSFLKTKQYFKSGMPVREEIEKGLEGEPSQNSDFFKIFIFGGSQGARGINKVVSQAIVEGGEWLRGVKIVHQTGRLDFESIKEKYTQGSYPVEVFEYIHDMHRRYQWADLVICRSGISTVAELAACGKAALLIPFPYASDNHQLKNAEVLVQKKAADLFEQQQFTPQVFKDYVMRKKENRNELKEHAQNVKIFYQPQAAQKVAQHLIQV